MGLPEWKDVFDRRLPRPCRTVKQDLSRSGKYRGRGVRSHALLVVECTQLNAMTQERCNSRAIKDPQGEAWNFIVDDRPGRPLAEVSTFHRKDLGIVRLEELG